MKCFKVVKDIGGKKVSCVLIDCPSVQKFAKEYRTDALTDHGMVFANNINLAISFMDSILVWKDDRYEVWEADAAMLIPCYGTTRLTAYYLKKFLKGETLTYETVYEPPPGTMFGFDVRLIRRVK